MLSRVNADKAPARAASNESLFAALARIYYAHESHRPKSHSGKLNKSMVSGPTSSSFAHVAHIGYDEGQGFVSTGVDQLEESKKIDVKDVDFEGGRLDKSIISGLGAASNSLVHAADDCYNEDHGSTSTRVDPWTGRPEDTSVEMAIMAASTSSIFDKSLISAPEPNSFARVAHIGYSDREGFTSTGVDATWTDALGRLEDASIEREMVAKDIDVVQTPIATKEPHKPNSPAPRSMSSGRTSSSVISGSRSSHARPMAPAVRPYIQQPRPRQAPRPRSVAPPRRPQIASSPRSTLQLPAPCPRPVLRAATSPRCPLPPSTRFRPLPPPARPSRPLHHILRPLPRPAPPRSFPPRRPGLPPPRRTI
ncbi:hypothetical protein K438DRAFT_1821346 [Mycena galopus ATCC 62051]|nr:hypothetical protein K438DRAFT_1821346 [Mycena galopus ATCC 62051]